MRRPLAERLSDTGKQATMGKRTRGQRPWWHVAGRHPSWPYLTALGMVLGGLLGLLWAYNPIAWSLASQTFPRSGLSAVLIDIDSGSLADYGNTENWNADFYRSAIAQLEQAGAKVIGLDILIDPARPDAAALNGFLADAGVVQAVEPGEALPAGIQGKYGLSVVNRSRLGSVPYSFQTGYRSANGELLPSLAWQLAHAAGADAPLNTRLQFLHRFEPSVLETRISLRDVMTGHFRYADVQDKVVVIGQASPDPLEPFGSELQVRAVASLLAPPYLMFPPWVVALIAALLTGLSTVLGRYWGLVLAIVMPALMLALWPIGVALSGLTFTLAALLGLLLAGIEYLLAHRRAAIKATLNEQLLGTRAGLSQAVEMLLTSSEAGQPCLFLVRLEAYRELEEQFGREWAEEAVDQGLRRLKSIGHIAPELEGFGFRWDDNELVFIVEPVTSDAQAQKIASFFAHTLSQVVLRRQPLQPWAGYAWIRPLSATAKAETETGGITEVSAQSLVIAARQTLRPAPVYHPAEGEDLEGSVKL